MHVHDIMRYLSHFFISIAYYLQVESVCGCLYLCAVAYIRVRGEREGGRQWVGTLVRRDGKAERKDREV
jgi:hypothetical protein